ncbi:hypothetical protein I3F58_06895 [Streptomyces sp. MUM 203J]|uniref:hypothetical protein n=1 Tax=Streptomyces sp. MUM 203J TaxID=2791990 RepID=UPI001F03DC93|nr:hypothetical protein [Streptomyces sp. MUM 203J]MCH0539290.1 hypothetical protein [Streptomyces sp. MUM 203J]
MPDRRRRTAIHLLPRERQSTDDSNPFAPPPEGRPDQPWQPRHPSGGGDENGEDRDGSGAPGGQWSPRQPGRSSGGFGGGGAGGGGGQGDGQGGPGREGPQLRWDPRDPAQRRARYALLGGMWGFFFAVFQFMELALLLGALSLYWGVSALRARSGSGSAEPAPSGEAASGAARSQVTAAVSGIITASLALLIVASMFTLKLVYHDFYSCVEDALTKDGAVACNERLPEPLRDLIGFKEPTPGQWNGSLQN